MSKYSCSGVLPCIIYPSTAKAAAAELLAGIQGTNNDVSACTTLDATTLTNWALFYNTAVPFLQESPGVFGLGTRMDRIASYAEDLYNWQNQLKQKGCGVTVPSTDPNAVAPETGQLLNLAHWGAYAVIAVAVAYGIGKAVEVLPKGGQRESVTQRTGRTVGAHLERAKSHLRRLTASPARPQ